MKKIRILGFMLALQLAAAGSAGALAIVDTGPGTGGGTAWTLSGSLPQSLAAEFSIGAAHVVNEVQGWIDDGPGTATAVIYTDGGDVPGLELFSAAFTVDSSADWFGPAGLSWALAPGTYWVAFEVRAGQALEGTMPSPSPSPLGNEAYSNGGAYLGQDNLDLGVRIFADTAVTVPAPQSLALLLTGVVGLVLLRRRRTIRA